MGKTIGGILLVIFLGFIFIGALRNAHGFSLAFGTLFSGTNQLGKTLEGR